jgi:WD40 repeat protein
MNNSDQKSEDMVNDVIAAYLRALDAGQHPDRAELLSRHAEMAGELRAFFADLDGVEPLAAPLRQAVGQCTAAVSETPTLGVGDVAAEAPLHNRVRYFGDYELLEEIARGGMGIVFRARQVSVNRPVALKMILAGQLASADDVKRFHAEAEAAANLDHANIVPIYEVGEHEGQHYFSMKLVEGGSLAAEAGRFRTDPRAAAGLVAVVARAVHHAHQRGILHRDLKPSNILLDREGCPLVTDFGLAKKIAGDSKLTHSGAIVGTPSYMAPEQAAAKKVLTTAADVYALGAILYELLTCQPPFRAETPLDTLLQVLEREVQPPRQLNPKVSRDLETVCLKCLRKEPEARYESAAALADDLDRCLRDEPVLARPVRAPERIWRWCRRNPVVAATSAAALVALGVAGGTLWWSAVWRTEQERQTVAWRTEQERQVVAKEQAETQERLYQSLVEQASIESRAGNRWHALDLLRQAVQSKTGTQLRPQTINAISASGIRCRGEVPTYYHINTKSPLSDDSKLLAVSGVRVHKPGVQVYEVPSGRLLRDRRDFSQPLGFRPGTSQLTVVRDDDAGKERPSGEIVLWDPVKDIELRRFAGGRPVFSPDGALIATHGSDGVHVWDISTGEERKTPATSHEVVFLSPRELLVLGEDRCSGWDVVEGRETFATPEGLRPVEVSGNGRVAVLRGRLPDSAQASTIVWDLRGSKRMGVIPNACQTDSTWHLSGDGTQVAVLDGGKRLSVKVWDVASQKFISSMTWRGVSNDKGFARFQVSFSPDGRLLVAIGVRGEETALCIWDVETGYQMQALPLIYEYWWGDHGRTLITIGPSVFGAKDGGLLGSEDDIRMEFGNVAAEYGKKRVEANGNYCNWWEIAAQAPMYLLDEAVTTLSFSEDGSRLATNAVLWDVKRGNGPTLRRAAGWSAKLFPALGRPNEKWSVVSGELFPVVCGQGELWAATFDPNVVGRVVFQQGGAAEAGRGDSDTRDAVYRLAPDPLAIPLPNPGYPELEKSRNDKRKFRDSKDYAWQVVPERHQLVFSPDGRRSLLASRLHDEGQRQSEGNVEKVRHGFAWCLELWDHVAPKRLAILGGFDEDWRSFAFSPDGRRAVSGSTKRLVLWKLADGTEEKCLANGAFEKTAFGAGGKVVIGVMPGKSAVLFDVESGSELRAWPAGKGEWQAFALHPSRPCVASGDSTGGVRLWDIETGGELAHWQGHEARVTALAFHPNGDFLVSGSADGTLRLWDLPYIRKELGTLGLDW